MKKIMLIAVTITLYMGNVNADNMFSNIRMHALGLQIGTDIGGALPSKREYMPSVFRAYPALSVSLGAKSTFTVAPNWRLGVEANYKTVAMDANALVENMLAFAPNTDANGALNSTQPYLKQYYSGQAKMNMSFTMLEMPLYATYAINGSRHRLLFGAYGAWIMNSTFNTDPQIGYIGNAPDEVGEAGPILTPLEGIMNFSNFMTHWDAGIVLGYEYQIFPRVNLGIRVMAGFKDIFVKDVYPNDPNVDKILEYNMTHMRGTFVLSYNLFESSGWFKNRKKQVSL